MTPRGRTLPLAAAALFATLVTACAGPTPSPAVATTASTPVATPAVSATPAPSAVSTPAPTATPVPSLAAAGIEVFSPLEQGHWVVVSSSDNLGEMTRSSMLREIGDAVEVHTICAGDGTVHVVATASPPATESANPGTAPVTIWDSVTECPETTGELFSGVATVPPGWFVSVDVEPSDPSILYQVLVGTIVD